MKKSESTSETMNRLFKEYGLVYDEHDVRDSDVFVNPKFKIIMRSGIEKIQAKENIKAEYKVVTATPFEVAILGTFTDKSGNVLQTFGEASVDHQEIATETTVVEDKEGRKKSLQKVVTVVLKDGNVKQKPAYPYAIAEKRCRSRGVLQLVGLYKEGFYGEDESDAFVTAITDAKNNVVKENSGAKVSSETIR